MTDGLSLDMVTRIRISSLALAIGPYPEMAAVREEFMGKHKGKSKSCQKAQPPSRWPKLLVPGVLTVVVVVGAATWFFLQRTSPQVVAAQYTGGARLAVDQDLIDFGNVRFEKFVTANFRVRNVGDKPLLLPANPRVDAVEGC